jgi:hypothetical protein
MNPVTRPHVGNLIARVFVQQAAIIAPELRADCYRKLSTIADKAEAEQLIIAADALDAAHAAQLQLFEVLQDR